MEQTNQYIDQVQDELTLIFRDLNSEMSFRFIKNSPEIFHELFESLSEGYLHTLYQSERKTEKELSTLGRAVDLLSPQHPKSKQKNLFSLVNEVEAKQYFEFNVKYLPRHLTQLISREEMDHPLLLRYRQTLSYQPLVKHINGETFLILNVWELYFFVLLNKIKQFKAKDRRPKSN